jgi:hypothetical protein
MLHKSPINMGIFFIIDTRGLCKYKVPPCTNHEAYKLCKAYNINVYSGCSEAIKPLMEFFRTQEQKMLMVHAFLFIIIVSRERIFLLYCEWRKKIETKLQQIGATLSWGNLIAQDSDFCFYSEFMA